jgi:hypothetical protein
VKYVNVLLKISVRRGQLKCDGTRAQSRFRLSAKRTSSFKLAGTSVQSTTGSRGVRISGSNAGYTMFRGSVKGTGYPLHSSVFFSLFLQCVTVCHHISTGVYLKRKKESKILRETTVFFRQQIEQKPNKFMIVGMVRESNPGGQIFFTCPGRPCCPSSLL